MLVRARTHVKAYERAFVAAGIPFEVGRGKGFYDTEEIADLVHLLRVVHDPRDRFALAAWLASPAVGATDDDLLAVFGDDIGPAAAGRGATFATRTRRRGRGRGVDGPCRPPARRSSACAARRSPAPSRRRCARRVEVFDAFETSLLQAGGGRRARNLRKAVAIARRLDAEGGHGLFDFLRRLTDLKDREVEESEAGTGGEGDAVSLLTIHGAKGLEWPCVVLAGHESGRTAPRGRSRVPAGAGRQEPSPPG